MWTPSCLSRGITRCPLGSHLPPVRRNEAQEPQAHHQLLLHNVTLNLWLAVEVQSERAIRLISKKKHQPNAVPGMDSALASTQKHSPEVALLPPGCEGSRGASTAASQGGKAAPVTCDPQQRTITSAGWGWRAGRSTSHCCPAPRDKCRQSWGHSASLGS